MKNLVEYSTFAPSVHTNIYRPYSFGSALHLHPFSATYNIALRNWRLLILTLPRCLGKYFEIFSDSLLKILDDKQQVTINSTLFNVSEEEKKLIDSYRELNIEGRNILWGVVKSLCNTYSEVKTV